MRLEIRLVIAILVNWHISTCILISLESYVYQPTSVYLLGLQFNNLFEFVILWDFLSCRLLVTARSVEAWD